MWLILTLSLFGQTHVSDLEITHYIGEQDRKVLSVSFKQFQVIDGRVFDSEVTADNIVVDGNPVVLYRDMYMDYESSFYYDSDRYITLTWDRKRIYYQWWDSKLKVYMTILSYDSNEDKK